MKDAKELLPWRVTDISIRPFDEMWSFNPSIHFDGQLWRCVLRCSDYAMPDGVTIRSNKARPAGNQTKNAMVIFDPQSWKPIQVFKMRELDQQPRVPCANVGFEDMRIFTTDRGGLQGIAASLHLERNTKTVAGGTQNQPPEQVLLSFNDTYDIVAAKPIRGDGWSGTPQKNWVPFDHCAEPRFLYSIDRGTLFDDRGTLHGNAAAVRPSVVTRAASSKIFPVQTVSPAVLPSRDLETHHVPEEPRPDRHATRPDRHATRPDRRTSTAIRGSTAQVVRGQSRGRRVSADTLASRPGASRYMMVQGGNDSTRVLGTGRTLLPKYAGLRGGTQLVRVDDDAWLGIGHEMQFVKGKKYYWHTWYLVDAAGKMKATSPPMKFVQNGIEFAAGLAIDGDRVVVSFGVDDMECKIGETRLTAVMEVLQKFKADRD